MSKVIEYRLDLVESRVGEPRCLVVGAMDGIQFDTLGPRILAGSWPVLFVEPNPAAFAKLQENFSSHPFAHFSNVAVGELPGHMDLYVVKPEVYRNDPHNAWMEGISTLNPEVGDMRAIPEEYRQKVSVPIFPLDQILSEHQYLGGLNVIQIDTEGYDAKILAQFPLERYQPQLIIMERVHITEEEYNTTVQRLHSLGYHLATTEFDLVASKGI